MVPDPEQLTRQWHFKQMLLDRLQRARGHMNAAERKVNYELERALWSGHQVRARVAEIHLWLDTPPAKMTESGHYLTREAMADRLQRLQEMGPAKGLQNALEATDAAEQALLAHQDDAPFDLPLSDQERLRLEASIERSSEYHRCLYRLIDQARNNIYHRFKRVRVGQWAQVVKMEDGHLRHLPQVGVVRFFHPGNACLFIPASARSSSGDRLTRYDTDQYDLWPAAPPCDPPPITVPAYYGLYQVWREWGEVTALRQRDSFAADLRLSYLILEVIEEIEQCCHLLGRHPDATVVPEKSDKAQQRSIPKELLAGIDQAKEQADRMRLQAERIYDDDEAPGDATQTALQLDQIVTVVTQVLHRLEQLIRPHLGLKVGDRVSLDQGCAGKIVAIDGPCVKVAMESGEQRQVRLFKDWLQRGPVSEQEADYRDDSWVDDADYEEINMELGNHLDPYVRGLL